MRRLLAPALLVLAASAAAEDCVPRFYNAEPRDATWFYGVGKGADASLARHDALKNLHLKVSGGQPGVPMDVLAGWEQDDHGECAGTHYVIDRIEKDRARANLARILERQAKPGAAQAAAHSPPPSVTVHNAISVPAPERRDDGLTYFALAAAFALAVAALALTRRRESAPAWAGGPSLPVEAEPRPRPGPKPGSLKARFAAVARQPQSEAMSEIAASGVLAYLKAHKGEGTCKSVAGSEEVVKAGAREMAFRYGEMGWTCESEPEAFYAHKSSDGAAMGFAFTLYASVLPGYVDCEILYAAGLPVEEGYRKQMEEGLHQGLPWAVQAAATRLGAQRSQDAG
jgi:hypothetical protein